MSKLEKLYNSIQSLKELGVKLPDELIEQTNRVEEEIIQKELIPALSNAIEPIINQIERELLLVVEYIPNEPLQIRMTRKRSFKFAEEEHQIEVKKKEFKKEQTYTLSPHTKSKKTNLHVIFPDGSEISNRFAYQTLCDVIEKVGVEKVKSIGLRACGVDLISKNEDDFYTQHKINGGYLVMTQTSTQVKKDFIKEISKYFDLDLKIQVK